MHACVPLGVVLYAGSSPIAITLDYSLLFASGDDGFILEDCSSAVATYLGLIGSMCQLWKVPTGLGLGW